MMSVRRRSCSPSSGDSASSCAAWLIAPTGLRISCAMLADSRPSAASFDCCTRSAIRLVSSRKISTVPRSPPSSEAKCGWISRAPSAAGSVVPPSCVVVVPAPGRRAGTAAGARLRRACARPREPVAQHLRGRFVDQADAVVGVDDQDALAQVLDDVLRQLRPGCARSTSCRRTIASLSVRRLRERPHQQRDQEDDRAEHAGDEVIAGRGLAREVRHRLLEEHRQRRERRPGTPRRRFAVASTAIAPTGSTSRMPRPLDTPPVAHSTAATAIASVSTCAEASHWTLGQQRRLTTTSMTASTSQTRQTWANSRACRTIEQRARVGQLAQRPAATSATSSAIKIDEPDDPPREVGRRGRRARERQGRRVATASAADSSIAAGRLIPATASTLAARRSIRENARTFRSGVQPPLAAPRVPNESARIPVEEVLCRLRHSRPHRRRRRHADEAVAVGRAARWLGVGGQGAGARGRPRQGRRRQAGARRPTTVRAAAKAHARPRLVTQADRPGRPADRPGVRRVRLRHRARAVPEPRAEPREGPHRRHRLRRRRHGHRGSRGARRRRRSSRCTIHPAVGLEAYQARELGFGLGSDARADRRVRARS